MVVHFLHVKGLFGPELRRGSIEFGHVFRLLLFGDGLLSGEDLLVEVFLIGKVVILHFD